MKKSLIWAPLSSMNFPQNTEKILDSTKNSDDNNHRNLRNHQKLASAYLNLNSPYRGLLLFHGLGSGKTRTAINLAENFKNERKTVVFLPGPALEENFIQELEKFDEEIYSPKKKHWILKEKHDHQKACWIMDTNKKANFSKLNKKYQKQINDQIRQKINEQYTIIRYNGISIDKLNNYIKHNILDNKLVIVDESHNIISMITNFLSDESNESNNMKGRLFWKLFMNSINAKFLFLTGTPILNYPKELSAVFNILQGHKILYKYQIKTSNFDKFREYMDKFPFAEYVNIKNKCLEIIKTPINFKLENQYLVEDRESPQNHTEWSTQLKKYVKKFEKNSLNIIDGLATTTLLNCFPVNNNFDSSFIQNENLINEEVFLRRIVGFVSYYDENSQNNNKENFPELITHPLDKLEMSMTQYIRYEHNRMNEMKQDATKIKRKLRMFEDEGTDVTTYRSRSLAVCNFAFPLKIDIDEIIINKNKQELYNKYIYELELFLHQQPDQELNQTFSELSPKYTKIIDRIEKSDGTNTIYSHLKNREGLNALFAMLHRKGWKKFNITFENNEWKCDHGKAKTYFIYEDITHKEYLKHIFNNDFSEIPFALQSKLPFKTNLDGEIIKAMFITASGSEGITLKNVRHLHIVEHHWSHIRIEQVIGRVNRFNSHADLPKEKRIVNVYKYVTIFGDTLKKKLMSNLKTKNIFDNIVTTDNGFTSDECVINVANRKKKINDKLLECLKISAIDCFKNIKNKCYQIDNNSYNPDFEKHILDSTINIAKKIELKQIVLQKKSWIPETYHEKKVLYDKTNSVIYDKESVKRGIPVKIAIYIKKAKVFQIIND